MFSESSSFSWRTTSSSRPASVRWLTMGDVTTLPSSRRNCTDAPNASGSVANAISPPHVGTPSCASLSECSCSSKERVLCRNTSWSIAFGR